MNEENIMNIRGLYFLNGEHPNHSFVRNIVNNIVDDSNYTINGIPLGFCIRSEEQDFWKNNIEKDNYSHLFPFLVLNKWSSTYPSSKELKEWIESYMNEKEYGKSMGKKVYEEMNHFKEDSTIYEKIPYIMPEIGFIIDSYLWEKHHELPSFIQNIQITEAIYDNYCQLFKRSLKTCTIDHTNINLLLNYCAIIDWLGGKRDCYMSLVAQLSEKENSVNLSDMITSIPQNKYDFEVLKRVICFYCVNYKYDNTDPFFSFWRKGVKDVERYGNLLLFLIERKWRTRYNDNLILHKEDFRQLVESEMRSLKREIADADLITEDACNIFYFIERYLWEEHKEVPSIELPIFISKYRDLLLTTVENSLLNSITQNCSGFQNLFAKCLQYAFVLDSKQYGNEGGRTVFLDILSKLTNNNQSDSLEKILPVYPYYGDEFGLILLNFLKEHKIVYNLSDETISSYEQNFTFDSWGSWWSEIKERLGTDGKPYNAGLCEMTPSHKCIIRYLNTCHYSIWNKCNDKSLQILKAIKEEGPKRKKAPIRKKVFEEIGKICKNEKKKIFDYIKPLTIKARAEGVDLFIKDIEKQVVAENKKNKNLTKNVHNRLYELLMETCNNNLPGFPFETKFDDKYAQKFADIWVQSHIVRNDEIQTINEITSEQLKAIQRSFDSSVWNKINADIIDWCKSFYENKEFVSSSSNVETDMSDDDSWSDYDDMRGEIDAHLGGL